MPIHTYQERSAQFGRQRSRYANQLAVLSLVRLMVFVAAILSFYFHFARSYSVLLYIAIALVVAFLFCIRLYDRIQRRADFAEALQQINDKEAGSTASNQDGNEYSDPHHPYSFDLDLFGDRSLFAFLNRTTTGFGRDKLAQSLLRPDPVQIPERQVAVQELAGMIDFRQEVQAAGTIRPLLGKDLDVLRKWLQAPPAFGSGISYRLMLLLPLLTFGLLLTYVFTEGDNWLTLFFADCAVNLGISFAFFRWIRSQLSISGTITGVLQQLSEQLVRIEAAAFRSPLLRRMQSQLTTDKTSASAAIRRLASLFRYLEFILNLVVSLVLNGLFLFHLHILFGLDRWKKKHGRSVLQWMETIGEAEALNSLANFSYNNSGYCFPELLEGEGFAATGLGHPLIHPEKRICNDLSLVNEKFVILTGSNMSGKSTFLRTLGINLVLARAGSVVCAQTFSLYPYELHVSMRISDSLQDSESLFYAELKRLQAIIRHLESNEKTFVILDEILRGTNSNDKHAGTAGLITRLAASRVCGIIATHDLTIAAMTTGYPGYMVSKCFESDIVNDELVFDYRIRDGVCSKLNASYLMRKMDII